MGTLGAGYGYRYRCAKVSAITNKGILEAEFVAGRGLVSATTNMGILEAG